MADFLMTRIANAWPQTRVTPHLQEWARSMTGALAIALASRVSVSFLHTNVPFSLQSQAVLLVGAFLGPARGFAAVLQYLMAGALGAPVFAGGSGGMGHLMGPTAGFLWSYLAAAPTVGFFAKRQFVPAAIGFALAAALTLVSGAIGLSFYFGSANAWALGVAPFWRIDAIKAALSYCVFRAVVRTPNTIRQ